jgi:hypothetical protein
MFFLLAVYILLAAGNFWCVNAQYIIFWNQNADMVIITFHVHITVSFKFTVLLYIIPNASLCHCIHISHEFLSHYVSSSSYSMLLWVSHTDRIRVSGQNGLVFWISILLMDWDEIKETVWGAIIAQLEGLTKKQWKLVLRLLIPTEKLRRTGI